MHDIGEELIWVRANDWIDSTLQWPSPPPFFLSIARILPLVLGRLSFSLLFFLSLYPSYSVPHFLYPHESQKSPFRNFRSISWFRSAHQCSIIIRLAGHVINTYETLITPKTHYSVGVIFFFFILFNFKCERVKSFIRPEATTRNLCVCINRAMLSI